MVFSRFVNFSRKHPIVRGMVAYSLLWPGSNLCQQTFTGKRWDNYDWRAVARFGLYGCFFVAPTFYGWIRLSSIIWPQSTLKSAITKVN